MFILVNNAVHVFWTSRGIQTSVRSPCSSGAKQQRRRRQANAPSPEAGDAARAQRPLRRGELGSPPSLQCEPPKSAHPVADNIQACMRLRGRGRLGEPRRQAFCPRTTCLSARQLAAFSDAGCRLIKHGCWLAVPLCEIRWFERRTCD